MVYAKRYCSNEVYFAVSGVIVAIVMAGLGQGAIAYVKGIEGFHHHSYGATAPIRPMAAGAGHARLAHAVHARHLDHGCFLRNW
jgi:hypothetical protein